jgi:hypothetical protein
MLQTSDATRKTSPVNEELEHKSSTTESDEEQNEINLMKNTYGYPKKAPERVRMAPHKATRELLPTTRHRPSIVTTNHNESMGPGCKPKQGMEMVSPTILIGPNGGKNESGQNEGRSDK